MERQETACASRSSDASGSKNKATRTTWTTKDAGHAVRDEALGCQQQHGRKLTCSLDQLEPMPGGDAAMMRFPESFGRLRLTGTATSCHAQAALLTAVPLPYKII
jgi:hypothetical protein